MIYSEALKIYNDIQLPYNEAIVLRIKQLLERDKLTLNGLAYKSGITQSTLDNIIKGNSKNPRIKTLMLIAEAFEMTIVEFLDTEEILQSEIE